MQECINGVCFYDHDVPSWLHSSRSCMIDVLSVPACFLLRIFFHMHLLRTMKTGVLGSTLPAVVEGGVAAEAGEEVEEGEVRRVSVGWFLCCHYLLHVRAA